MTFDYGNITFAVFYVRWHYAMNSVLEEDIRRRKMMWSWSHIVQHRRTMRQYREAYVKKLDGKKVSKELQKTLTVSCHRFYSIWGGEGGVGLCLYPLYSVKRRILFDSVTVFLLFVFCRWRWVREEGYDV